MPSSDINVKICGVRTAGIVQSLIDNGVAYAGLVFFPKSPRNISVNDAQKLCETFKGSIKFVGLFVDMPMDEIIQIQQQLFLDAIQLHGAETPEMIQQLRAKLPTPTPIIKAIGVASLDDINDTKIYWDIADVILFDTKPNSNDTLPGGLGRSFDHQLLNQASQLPKNWWLAGGLNANNIVGVLSALNHKPAVIDLSSSVEESAKTGLGVKSKQKITTLMNNLQSRI